MISAWPPRGDPQNVVTCTMSIYLNSTNMKQCDFRWFYVIYSNNIQTYNIMCFQGHNECMKIYTVIVLYFRAGIFSRMGYKKTYWRHQIFAHLIVSSICSIINYIFQSHYIFAHLQPCSNCAKICTARKCIRLLYVFPEIVSHESKKDKLIQKETYLQLSIAEKNLCP